KRKKRKLLLSFIIIIGLFLVYAHQHENLMRALHIHPYYSVGDLDENGRLVFLAWDMGVYKSLDYDYGMMILKTDDKNGKKISYEFYSQPDRRIEITRSLKAFEKLIQTIPRGKTIYNYDKTCAYMPFCRDENVISGVKKICKKHGINFDCAEYVICTCRG
ncbi:MAG: hypothetical protein GY859_35955, partial [Desulfobacterales bacterium]|nr:hypothetical protein [Desulfobacterales bacterium]